MRRFPFLLAAALALSACLPVTTKSPLGSTAGLKADPALYGMWEAKPESDPDHAKHIVFLAILPGDDGAATAVFFDLPQPLKSADWAHYAITTTALGPYRYINARAVTTDGHPADDAEAQTTFPLLYRFDASDKLTLYLIDEDAAKAAVNDGKIAGTVARESYGDVVLTAAPAALDAYFASGAGRALFTKPLLVMRRVK